MPLPRSAKQRAVHLVKPEVCEPLMPSWVPAHREVILSSGVAKVAAWGRMPVQIPMIRAAIAAARTRR